MRQALPFLAKGSSVTYDELVPRVTLRTDTANNGQDESLTEYICDWPDCPNVAEHVVGVVRELRASVAFCPEHARMLAERSKR